MPYIGASVLYRERWEVHITASIDQKLTMLKTLEEHLRIVKRLEDDFELIEKVATLMYSAVQNGRSIFWCGNGGSAADCQHLAAELVGRFERSRKGLASVALTTDSSI